MFKREGIKEHLTYMLKDPSLADKTEIIDIDSDGKSLLKDKVRKQMFDVIINDKNNVDYDFEIFVNTAKFTILVITYMFEDNEGELDKKQKKIINKIVARHKSLFSNQDIDELIEHISKHINLDYLMEFVNTHRLNEKTLGYVFHVINKNLKMNEEYRSKLKLVKQMM